MKRFVVVLTVWAMALAGVMASVVFPSTASAAPTTAGAFVSVAPSRLLNTLTGVGAPKAAVKARGTVHLQVTGRGGVPNTGVSAVVLNVAVVAPTSSGYITAHAGGTARPGASNLNFVKGQTVPNLVIAPVGAGGIVDLHNGSTGTTQLVADISGYYVSGAPAAPGAFGALAPSRLLSSLTGVGAPKAAVAPRATVHLKVTGRGGVPASGVSAVVMNVAVVAPTSAGYITVHAGGTARPGASNLNFVKGQTVPNLVIAPVGANGIVDLHNGSTGTVKLVADVSGYFLSGAPATDGAFGSVVPVRLMDTLHGVGVLKGPVRGRDTVHLKITGRGGVPASGVTAVVMNVSVVAPTRPGYITAHGGFSNRPMASNLNFVKGQTVPNLVIAPIGANGMVDLHNGSDGNTQIVADITGYFMAAPPVPKDVTPPAPATGLKATTVTDAAGVRVVLTWTNPTNADFTGMTIVRKVGPVPPANITDGQLIVSETSQTSYINAAGLADGTQYSYAVFAHDASGNHAVGAGVTVITTVGKVTNVVGIGNSATSIALTWINPGDPDFTGVTIVRKVGTLAPTSRTDGTVVTTITDKTVKSFTDTGLTTGQNYSYAVYANDSAGNLSIPGTGTARAADAVAPASVTGVYTTPGGANAIGLHWTNPTDADFTGVTIRHALGTVAPAAATDGDPVGEMGAGDTYFVDSGLTIGKVYSFAFFAHDGAGNYAAAATVTVTVPGTLDVTQPGPVRAITSVVTDNSITLSWINPTDPDLSGVMIRRAEGTTAPATVGDGTLVATAPAVLQCASQTVGCPGTTTDTGLIAGTDYSYALFAHDDIPNYSAATNVTVRTTGVRPADTAAVLSISPKLTVGVPFNVDASSSKVGPVATLASATLNYGDLTPVELLTGDPKFWTSNGHSFSTTGEKIVTLTVTDTAKVTKTVTATVNVFDVPTATITATGGAAELNVPVTFALDSPAIAGTAITSYSLSVAGMNNVTGGVGPLPATRDITFTSPGTYEVVFSVANDAGGTSVRKSVTVVIASAVSTAVLSISDNATAQETTTSAVGQSLGFWANDTVIGPNAATMVLDFGDGTPVQDFVLADQVNWSMVDHTFTTAGVKQVTLTIKDAAGLVLDQKTVPFTVTP